MTRAIAILRNLLWAEGAFLCLGVPQVTYYLVQRSGSYHSTDSGFVALQYTIYAGLAALLIIGVVAVVAAYALEQYLPWAPKALAAISVANLVLIPVGTAIGAFGLWIVFQPQARAHLQLELGAAGSRPSASPLVKPTSWMGRIVVGAQIVTSLLLVPLTAAYLKSRASPTLGYWQFVSAFLMASLLGILLHELGHVIAGKISGLRFQTLSAGPLVVSLLSDGWRVHWVNSLGLWNGMTVMTPVKPWRLRSNAFVFVLGGPLGSLLCGAVALSAMLAGPTLGLGPAAEFFGILGVIELVNFVANLIPLQVPGGYTDGARLLQLIRKTPEGERFLAELAFGLSDSTTLRPKDWHPRWVEAVTEDPAAPGFSRGCYHAYVYHLDRGEIDDASIWLARCMDSHQALKRDRYRWVLAIENAFFEARHLKNLGGAKEWLNVPRAGIPAERFTVARVQAAIHIAEGERDLARKAIDVALRLHAGSAGTGRQQFERDVLRDVQNWFDERTGSSGLSRLAQAVRERDLLVEASHALEGKPGAVRTIQKILRPNQDQ